MKINKKLIKVAIKIFLTLIALYWVFSKVNFKDIQALIRNANLLYLLLAFLFFNLSKIVSSYRLNLYFRHITVYISELYALKLYYIGMFYNLFLPGGIGGDGYKVYLLQKEHEVRVKTLITATLLDRLSGLVPLLFLAGVLFCFSDYYGKYHYLDILVVLGILTVFPLVYLLNRILFKSYLPLFYKTLFLGTGVQLLQLLSAFFIVFAIAQQEMMILFLTLFLISSVVAVLPISLGGVGIRELTFMYGLTLIEMEVAGGVVFSLLFFLITALSSLIGVFLSEKEVTKATPREQTPKL